MERFRDLREGDSPIYTDSFKRWFGDWENDPKSSSKIVGEDGKPLVVYHNTDSEFTSFDRDMIMGDCLGDGFYFSDAPHKVFGSNTMRCYLNVRNPYVVENLNSVDCICELFKAMGEDVGDEVDGWYDYYIMDCRKNGTSVGKSIISKLLEDHGILMSESLADYGYDGVIYFNTIGGIKDKVKIGREYVVFNPNQIKSIDNNGGFSTDSDNIYESED